MALLIQHCTRPRLIYSFYQPTTKCFVFLLVSFFTWMHVTVVLKELPCSKTWIYYWIDYLINKCISKNISFSHLISDWSFQIKIFSNILISYIISLVFNNLLAFLNRSWADVFQKLMIHHNFQCLFLNNSTLLTGKFFLFAL